MLDQENNTPSSDEKNDSIDQEHNPNVESSSEEEIDESAALKEEIAKLKDQLMRSMADQENLRKRAERDKTDMAKYAIAEFAKELVSVADNFERAFASIPEDQVDEHPLIQSLLEGLKMTEGELMRVLGKHGIKKCEPGVGDKFDPNLHQAMMEVEHDAPQGHIAQVMQIGYTHHERLLRPAMVGVSKGPASKNEDEA